MRWTVLLGAKPSLLTMPIEWLTSLFAGLMMMVIIFSMILLWPITYLGYDSSLVTQEIIYVVPGSPADQAGLRTGDRILELYGRSIQEVAASLSVVNLIGPRDQPIPITLQRGKQTITTSIRQEPPALSFQALKLAMCGLALLCWTTGYYIGVVRRHEVAASPLVAGFWLCMGGLMGSLLFALYTAFPIFIGELWLIITVLAPLAVYIHFWFPYRSLGQEIPLSPKGILLFHISLFLNLTIAIWIALHGARFLALADVLFLVMPFATIAALAASGCLLTLAYRKAASVHIRRQIRLIAVACLSVMLIWTLLFVLPEIILGRSLMRPRWFTLLYGLVPLAYLISSQSPDLYRLDREALRLFLHLLTATTLGLLLGVVGRLLTLQGTPAMMWLTVAFVVCYRPLRHLWIWLLPGIFGPQNQQALDQAIQELAMTLDTSALVSTLVKGVCEQFGQPAFAFFLTDMNAGSELRLQRQARMAGLPLTLMPGQLTDHLCQGASLLESRALHQMALHMSLREDEQRLLEHPAIVLWCPIYHSQGPLLGLLVLGMRADFDRYHSLDLQGLQRLVAAASLAFTKSAAYEEIRHLYRALQDAQDTAAAELARKLHDQVINGNMRLNVAALKNIVRQLQDDDLRDRLVPILQREKQLIYQLPTFLPK